MSDNWFELQTPAKVNLFFELLKKRSDGYHDVSTLVAPVDFFDSLRVRAIDQADILLNCSTEESTFGPLREESEDSSLQIPSDERNLAYKAAKLLQKSYNVKQGVEIQLKKSIPPQSGLGGGSGNAAGVLQACAAVWNLNLSNADFMFFGSQLGSDVPLFFVPGMSLATGRGEIIEPMPQNLVCPAVIVRPPVGISTPAVYGRCQIPEQPKSAQLIIDSITEKNYELFYSLIFNRLELYAAEISPWVEKLREAFIQTGARGGCLCGSGSSYFGIFDSSEMAQKAAEKLRQLNLGLVIVTNIRL